MQIEVYITNKISKIFYSAHWCWFTFDNVNNNDVVIFWSEGGERIREIDNAGSDRYSVSVCLKHLPLLLYFLFEHSSWFNLFSLKLFSPVHKTETWYAEMMLLLWWGTLEKERGRETAQNFSKNWYLAVHNNWMYGTPSARVYTRSIQSVLYNLHEIASCMVGRCGELCV